MLKLYNNLKPFVHPYRWLVVIALVLTIFGSLVGQVNALIMKYTVDSVSDLLTQRKDLSSCGWLLAFIFIAFISKEVMSVLIQVGQKYYGERLRIYLNRDLSQTVIDKILSYKMSFFSMEKNNAGKLQSRIDRGIDSITRLIQNLFIDILPLVATALVAMVMLFVSNIYVGLISLFVLPFYFYVSRKQAKKLGGARRQIRTFREYRSHGIITILESIPVIKSFVREDIESKKQMELQSDLTQTQMKIRQARTWYEVSNSIIEQLALTFIVIVTVFFILKGQMTIGAIMFNIMLFANVSAPIRQLHRIYDEVNEALVYSEGFFEIINAENVSEQTGEYRPKDIQGNFVLEQVNFLYPNGTQALFDVSMKIERNKVTAIVGLSGAGKSTIINLLDKFYIPQSGSICLDGKPLQEYDTAYLRQRIGLVLQKNHIFAGSIDDNIRYGDPNASQELVREAAKSAFIHDQIMQMPDQYNTKASELSGGQQQRIAIARMFLKNPPIIFLDEPTASLDAVATEQIKNSIDAIKKNRTVVIISHSISQIIDADVIYAMKDGRVVEYGTHEEIYHLHGTYHDIFNSMVRSLNIDKITDTLKDL